MTSIRGDEVHDSPRGGIERLLADANPVDREDLAAFESARGFDDLFDRIVAVDALDDARNRTDPARRRRTRRTVASLALAATLLAGGATAAAAKWSSAHTGEFGQPGMTENDTSEWLDLGADDAPRIAAHLAEGISFAPGDSAQAYIPSLVRTPGLMQVTGVRRYLTDDALCGWWGSWLQAEREGNATDQARATAVLQAAPTWPIIVATDGGGVVTYDEKIAASAQRGDPSIVQQAFTANCETLPRNWEHK
jgi:hypothetical protein